MSQSAVQSLVKQYRGQVRTHVLSSEHLLRQAHTHLLASLKPHVDWLLNQLKPLLSSGQKVPITWLHTGNRLKSLTSVLEQHIQGFVSTIEGVVSHTRQMTTMLGRQAGTAMVKALMPEGKLPSVPSLSRALPALATFTRGMTQDVVSGVRRSLTIGLSLGQDVVDISKGIWQKVGEPLWKGITLLWTQAEDAYRGIMHDIFRENDGTVAGWWWQCSFEDSCIACIAMHGTKHDVSEDLDDHIRGECEMVPFSAEEEPDVQSGADWFDEQETETQQDILGPGKYDLYASGDVSLDEMVGVDEEGSIYEKPLKQLVKG